MTFLEPQSADVSNYLSRMHMGRHLDRLGVHHRLPSVHARNTGRRLVELLQFDSARSVDTLLDALMDTVLHEYPWIVQPLYAALAEIAGNAVEHSGRGGGFLALQRYRRRRRIEFAVGDSRVGLRARLGDSRAVTDDGTAIVVAAETHMTTTDQPGRGRGISEVIRLAGARHGAATLTSGRASGTFSGGSLRPQLQALPEAHPGTLAHVRLSLVEGT